MRQVFLSTTLPIVSSVSVLFSSSSRFCFQKMTVIHQIQFDSFLVSKKYFLRILAALFLLFTHFVSESFASANTVYIKGLGAVLREQPSIQSKKLTNLSRGTKVLVVESKGIWQKVESGENLGWLLRGQISKFPVKRKKLILGQKIQLQSASGRRIRLRTFSAVIGVRGLVDSKGKKISPYKTDYVALEWLEKQPSNEEISVIFLSFTE
jgi:uncharacterized protein YgiM (DUF1202 family)|tara:strand:- start:121 stop:747 length:627 start_codon:yes stop_codon:yes gene_type:complete